jgi:hypothetical protein
MFLWRRENKSKRSERQASHRSLAKPHSGDGVERKIVSEAQRAEPLNAASIGSRTQHF